MLVKSIIAGTVLSLMAGGIVYFGTDLDTAAVKEKVAEKTAEMKAEISDKVMAGDKKGHPHGKKTAAIDTETSVDMPSVKTASGKTIKAKKPTVSYSSGSEDKPSEKTSGKKIKTAEVVSPDKSQKKWLNQYLKKDKAPEEKKSEGAKNLMKSMGLTKEGNSDSDTGSFVVENKSETLTEEQIEMAETEGFEARALEPENIWVEEYTSEKLGKKSTRKMLHDIIKKDSAMFIGEDAEGEKKIEVKVIANEDGETTIETETIDMGDGKMMKIVKKTMTSESHDADGKKMRIKVITNKDDMKAEDIKMLKELSENDKAIEAFLKPSVLFEDDTDISATVKIVMEQAEKIEMSELRDRAYLDLVSYGIDHGNYDVAAKALTKIEQVELRDTARNRMAVAYAKEGNAEDAFGILEDIEVDALRDVMRLQVIEAMIAPDELPEDMQ